MLYQDSTFQDSASPSSAFFLQSNLSANPHISGSLDIPSALSELRESKIDSFQYVEIYRTTSHDFFQHEADLSIIPMTDTINIDKLNLDHLHKSTASQLKNVLESYKSIFATLDI